MLGAGDTKSTCLLIGNSVTLLPFSIELTQEGSGKQAQRPAFGAHMSDPYPHGVRPSGLTCLTTIPMAYGLRGSHV